MLQPVSLSSSNVATIERFSLPLPVVKSGERVVLPPVVGSADALIIARLALAHRGTRQLAVLTAGAGASQRLLEEILWMAPQLKVRLLPDWETLPYDSFSPHHDLVSERLASLYALQRNDCDVLLVPAATAMYRFAPPAFLAAYTFFLTQGETLNLDKFRAQLTLAGYSHVTQVVSPGEYSIRGGLIDLYPMGSAYPYRLDLFDDEVETIKTFDVDTQRTLDAVQEIRLLPAREFPFDEKGRTRFRQRFRERFEGDPAKSAIYKEVSNGIPAPGIEYWLPLFFEETATIFDYLSEETILCLHNDISSALHAFWQDAKNRYDLLSGDTNRPLLKPDELFLTEEAFFTAAKPYARLVMTVSASEEVNGRIAGGETENKSLSQPLPVLAIDRRAEEPLARLKAFIGSFPGRVLFLAESAGRRETLAGLFNENGVRPQPLTGLADFLSGDHALALTVSPLFNGFILAQEDGSTPRYAFITETELFAGSPQAIRRSKRDKARRATLDNWLRDLSELKVGDPVVHEKHGIARYCGLVHMDMGDGDMEFLELHYADEAKLYVPVSNLHVISRYSGVDPDAAPIHSLGTAAWEKAKKRAALQARDTAAELLSLYAVRAAREGHAFEFSMRDYDAFADGFGFEETPDQEAAIKAVLEDMRSGKPMDRLVCGDVGFGKTEVALRASFAAVAGGKQVAILCPTTLLCEQHSRTFSDRFADWPVKVAELSRFNTAKETTQALEELESGKIDIVIGTHKLLQKSVKFKRLGLVIIDEEHRFGVRQKEALKALRAEVDVLTLTATPIPRTLGLSLEGLRDFSVIATAPQKRLAVKTFVSGFSNGIVREALLREFKRGGQVYFLHNEVSTIENMRDTLVKLVPEARILVGHGQMNERELERVMRDFTTRRANLLLCTTIIETGIDNPHANTIIINRADKFGLAQLHQLRGRVGRSHHQAYAYLLTPNDPFAKGAGLTKQARLRLEAIQRMDELGSGFYLAMHDLEIRGAGEILGENQSGEMQEVGFNLFTEMLNRAISALKQGKEPDPLQALDISTEINLHIPALLPNDYAPDVHERLTLYKRLANCENLDEINEMHEELVDRFGPLPTQAESLLESHRLRLLCKPYGITRVDAAIDLVTLQFVPNPPIEPIRIIELIQKNRNYKLAGPDRLSFKKYSPTLVERVQTVKELLKALK